MAVWSQPHRGGDVSPGAPLPLRDPKRPFTHPTTTTTTASYIFIVPPKRNPYPTFVMLESFILLNAFLGLSRPSPRPAAPLHAPLHGSGARSEGMLMGRGVHAGTQHADAHGAKMDAASSYS
jgi:hypothetical protein